VCDNQGHFGVKYASGYIFQYYYDPNNEPPKTRQGAIDRAWDQYEYDHKVKEVPKKYNWRECDNGKRLINDN
jgi:phenylpropionate dioxygenase-like ring-hydroxylating dioxygenase large terminal subunit